MGTQVILSSPNYSGYIADITFSAQTGGTISLGLHMTPYTVDLDYIYGTYELCYSAFNKCCSTTIIAPTPTPTITPTQTTTPTNTQTPTVTQTPTRTAAVTPTQTRTPTPTKPPPPTYNFVIDFYVDFSCSSFFRETRTLYYNLPPGISSFWCDQTTGKKFRVFSVGAAGSYTILDASQWVGPYTSCSTLPCP